MTPRLLWTAVAGVAMALAVVLTIAVAELPKGGGESPTRSRPAALTPAQVRERLEGSPPALEALHAQGGELLAGGAGAWAARLRSLRGLPVVVNKWASWCVPCQGERVAFQRASADWGRRVAFLGIDSGDTSRADAQAFLRATPALSYPSFYDASGALGRSVSDSSFTPVTVILDGRGGRYIHQGPYESAGALERDIERYALAAGA